MESHYLNVIVIFLVFAVTVNLYLTTRLIKSIHNRVTFNDLASPLEAGMEISDVTALNNLKNEEIDLAEDSNAKVFIFLHTGCPTCRERIDDVEEAVNLSKEQAVNLYMITTESFRKSRRFLKKDELLERLLNVDKDLYRQLNPKGSSPSYLFINDENIIEAEGLIGDENWLNFIQQLTPHTEVTSNETSTI
jgi:peroxiredoxin